MSVPANNGTKIYTLLVEFNTRTNQPTGRVKSNIPSDPNYIPPATDLVECPIPSGPVFTYMDVIVAIAAGYTVNIQLTYNELHIDTGASGTWHIVDRTYDGVIFQVSAVAGINYIVKITYDNGASVKAVNVGGVTNLFIPGPFNKITRIELIDNTGDYNKDYSDDYYN